MIPKGALSSGISTGDLCWDPPPATAFPKLFPLTDPGLSSLHSQTSSSTAFSQSWAWPSRYLSNSYPLPHQQSPSHPLSVLKETLNSTSPIQYFLIPQFELGASSMFLQVLFPLLTNHLYLSFFHTDINHLWVVCLSFLTYKTGTIVVPPL